MMASMARIPYPDPAALSPETQEFLARLPSLNIFRMMAGGEGLLRAFSRFGNHLLYKSALDPVLREIAIVRVGVLSDASYELHQHDAISRSIGMSDELIRAIRAGADDPAFDDLQRLVVAYTDDVVANVRASDETFDALRGAPHGAGAAGADRHDRFLHGRVALPRDVRGRHRGLGGGGPRRDATMTERVFERGHDQARSSVAGAPTDAWSTTHGVRVHQ